MESHPLSRCAVAFQKDFIRKGSLKLYEENVVQFVNAQTGGHRGAYQLGITALLVRYVWQE